MKQVAKILIVNSDNKYLLLYRDNHPIFGKDPDLPGGTVETNEESKAAIVRETKEETGLEVDVNVLKSLYSGTEYSNSKTVYNLFEIKLDYEPEITLSWEHSEFAWLNINEFLNKSLNAKDAYMHMVYEVLNKYKVN